jgi:DNA polymerase-3 subunit delta
MGGLDQETAKLALVAAPLAPVAAPASAADKPRSAGPAVITAQLVEQVVGGWRAKVAWDMIDAAASGDAREAMLQLDRLILAGESPIALMGQTAWRFRQLAAAARIATQSTAGGGRANVRQALAQAGVKTWPAAMDKAEANLRQLGARRATNLYRWLVEADLALKGSSSRDDRARIVLEKFFVRLSHQLGPRLAKRQ